MSLKIITSFLFLFIIGANSFGAGPAKKLLLIGDSHTVGGFGASLDLLLKQNFAVSRVAASGASTFSFFRNANSPPDTRFCYSTRSGLVWTGYDGRVIDVSVDKIQSKHAPCVSELQKPLPDLLVIALGSNQLGYGELDWKKQISDILSAFKGVPCVWIAPPSMRYFGDQRVGAFHKTLSEVAGHCTVFQSAHPSVTVYDPVKGDGIHYSNPVETQRWAEAANACIRGQYSAFCIRPSKVQFR